MKPSASPTKRRAPSGSWTPNERASNTTQSGTVAMSMPVTDELIHCSPQEMTANGIANSARANAQSAAVMPAQGSERAPLPRYRQQDTGRKQQAAPGDEERWDFGHGHLDQEIRDSPDHTQRRECRPRSPTHRVPLTAAAAPNCINCGSPHSTAERDLMATKDNPSDPLRGASAARPRGARRHARGLAGRDQSRHPPGKYFWISITIP